MATRSPSWKTARSQPTCKIRAEPHHSLPASRKPAHACTCRPSMARTWIGWRANLLIMRRALVDHAAIGLLRAVAHMFTELVQHLFQQVDAATLLVDHLVQGFDQVFLLRQLDFDIDEAHFHLFCIFHSSHGDSWHQRRILPSALARQVKQHALSLKPAAILRYSQCNHG